jgi:stage V sporulation protein D (sporulation-specific penicillin-binding protein)
MGFPDNSTAILAVKRVRIWYALLVFIIGVFGVRLFYVQIIRYDHYKSAALADQLKQEQIPATRGIIEAHDGDTTVPIVLNQELYTIFADPVDMTTYKTDRSKVATVAAQVLGGPASQYLQDMYASGTRYSVLAEKVSQSQRDAIMNHKFAGLYSQGQDYRTYPQGSLASQLLGFVDNSGQGQYGIEQAENGELSGTPGELKAITDLNGVPLAATKGNVEIAPKNGDNLTLTVNLGMQAQMESILKKDYASTKSQGLSAVIIDPNTGQVKAMANYPTYDPSQYSSVTNPDLFQNGVVSDAIEPGSTMKLLTTAAALNQGVITPTTTFYDPAQWTIDGFTITDIEQDGGPRVQSIESTLNLSLNTGATWMLMQMGGGQINQKARDAWYDYMTNHFLLGQATGIEQGYESAGLVPTPEDNGAGIDLTYANTSFGQGVLVTPIQMAAAVSSILNGGTYYQPYLIDQTTDANGKTTTTQPKILKKNVVSAQVGQDMLPLMEYVVQQHQLDGCRWLLHR